MNVTATHQALIPPNQSTRSFSDAVAFILNIENELSLVNQMFFGNAPIWPYLRTVLATMLATKTGAFSNNGSFRPLPRAPRTGFDKWIRLNPFLRFSKKRFVLIGSPVVYQCNNRKTDIYLDDLASVLPVNETEIIRLDGGSEKGTIPCYDYDLIERLYQHFRGIKSRRIDCDVIELRNASAIGGELEVRIRAEFDCTVAMTKMLREAGIHYTAQRRAWKSYFQLRRPDYVIMGVQCYGHEGLVAAAHECGAYVVERQHGLINRSHFGYHFPGRPVVPNRPDLLLIFGPGWSETAEFPCNTALKAFGFAPVNEARRRVASGDILRSRKISVLSCDPFHSDLMVSAIDLILQHFTDVTIVVRPHPSDCFDYVARLAAHDRVIFSSSLNPVHELLASSEFLVTGPSTVAFEGLALGCKVICFAPQYEPFFKPLFAQTPARMVSCVTSIPAAMPYLEPSNGICHFFTTETPHLLDLMIASQSSCRH